MHKARSGINDIMKHTLLGAILNLNLTVLGWKKLLLIGKKNENLTKLHLKVHFINVGEN